MRAAPTYFVDMTPPAFVFSGLFVAYGLFRFRIMRLVPLARDAIFDYIGDGTIYRH